MKNPSPLLLDREGEIYAVQTTFIGCVFLLTLLFILATLTSSTPLPFLSGILLLTASILGLGSSVAGWLFLRRSYLRNRRAESAFLATTAIIKGFFDSTPMRMGVVKVLPADIRHIWDNAAASLQFGLTPLDLEDKLETDLDLSSESRKRWLRNYQECLIKGAPIRFEYAEGEGVHSKWFAATVCPISWSHGVDRHCAYVCQDITDLVLSRFQAEEASHAKSVFLATMSHELRTPLNSIIGFANVLMRQPSSELDSKARGYLDRIHRNGRHLLEIINDILDLSKVEVGRMELRSEQVQLPPLLQEVLSHFESLSRDKGLRLEALGINDSVLPLRTDPVKLRQILINLVGNAIKFTEQGSVTLVLIQDPEGNPQTIEVRDSGIGIPESQLESVFEPFRQADSSISRKYGGSGLGLSISRSLAVHMGFQLHVSSQPGMGTQFKLDFNKAPNENTVSLSTKKELRH